MNETVPEEQKPDPRFDLTGLDVNTPPPQPEPDIVPATDATVPDVTDQVLGFQRMRRAQLRAALSAGVMANPDAHAKAMATADQLGIPTSAVVNNQKQADEIVAKNSINDKELDDDYKQVAHYLSSIDNASIAHDDIGSLKNMSDIIRTGTGDSSHGLLSSSNAFFTPDGSIKQLGTDESGKITEQVFHDIPSYIGHLINQNEKDKAEELRRQWHASELQEKWGLFTQVAAGFRESVDATKGLFVTPTPAEKGRQEIEAQAARDLGPDMQNWHDLGGLWNGAQRMVGGLLADAPLFAVGGEIAGPVGAMWRMSKTLEALSPAAEKVFGRWGTTVAQEGVPTAVAMAPVNLKSATEKGQQEGVGAGIADFIASSTIMGVTPSGIGGRLAKLTDGPDATAAAIKASGRGAVLSGALSEIGMQSTQQASLVLSDALIDRVNTGKPIDQNALFLKLVQAGALGGVIGGVASIHPELAAQHEAKIVQSYKSVTTADKALLGIQVLQQSKLNKRAPDAMGDAMAQMQGEAGGTVFMGGKDWQEHWIGEGADPVAMAEKYGVDESYKESQATGTDMEIPTDKYMQAGAESKNPQKYVNKTRFNVDQMTPEEAVEYRKNLPKIAQEHSEALGKLIGEAISAPSPEASQIHEDLYHQLIVAHPQGSEEQLQTYAKNIAGSFQVMGARAGKSALELYHEFPLQILTHEDALAAHQKIMEAASGKLDTEGLGKLMEGLKEPLKEAQTNAIPEKLAQEMPQVYGSAKGERGSLQFGADKTFRMVLNKATNTSTVMHELMHYWFEVMGHLSQREGTPQALKDDYQKMLEFSGYGTHENKLAMQAESLAIQQGAQGRELTPEESKRVEELNAPHEKIAQAHEAYMYNGKAPTEELKGVFAKIKAWMMKVYDDISKIGVELNPEITAVFDRIHASDEAIAEASKELGNEPNLTEEQLGKGPEAYAAYIKRNAAQRERELASTEKEAMRALNDAQTEEYKKKRAETQDEVENEVAHRQVYEAIENLQHGKGPDGEPLPEEAKDGLVVKKWKLDQHELEALGYKLEDLPGPDHPRNPGARVYAKEDGLELSRAAELFHYDSIDAMIKDLINAPNRKQTVQNEVNAVMAKAYPDALNNGTLKDTARDKMHTRGRAQLDQDELEALEKLANKVGKEKQKEGQKTFAQAISLAVCRAFARRSILQTRQRDLNPDRYRVAESKAAKEVTTALSKGDYRAAFEAKQRKVLLGEFYRAAKDAQRDTMKIPEYVKSTDKTAFRERIGKAGGREYTLQMPDGSEKVVATQAEAIRESRMNGDAPFERTSSYLQQMDRIKAMYQFHKISLQQLGRMDSLRAWIAKRQAAGQTVAIPESVIDQASQVSWRDLSVDKLLSVRDALKNIEKIARLKNKMEGLKDKREFSDVITLTSESMAANSNKDRGGVSSKGLMSKLTDPVGDFINAQYRVPDLIYRMDGHEYGGIMFDNWLRPQNDSADAEQIMVHEDVTELHDAMNKWGKLSGLDPRTWLENAKLMNRETIPGVRESLNKWSQLTAVIHWGNEGNREGLLQGNKFTTEEMNNIINHQDAKDKELVEFIWKWLSKHRSEIGALEERTHGEAPEWVEPTPFSNHLGTWSGGYAPIVYDNSRYQGKYNVPDQDGKSLMEGRGAAYAMTAHGFTKERTQRDGRPLNLDFGIFTNHMAKVAKDLAWRETLINQNRMLRDDTFRNTMQKSWGAGTFTQFSAQLDAIAGVNQGGKTGFEPVLGALRQGGNAAMRAFNVAGSLQQLAGLPFIIPRVGLKNFAKGLIPAFSPEAHHRMEAMEPFMRFRNAERGKMLNEAIRDMSALGPLRKFPDTAYMFMNKAWSVLDAHAWYAHYYQALEAGHTEEKAGAIATVGMTSTQGATHTKDMAAAMRGGELAKVFTNNMGWANASFNLMMQSVQRYADKGYTGAAASKMASDMLTYLVVCPAVYLAARQFISGQNMSDWNDPKKTAKHLGGEMLYTVLSAAPVAREAAHALQEGRRAEGIQGTSSLSTLINLGGDISRAFQDDIDGKIRAEHPGLSPTGKALINTGGILFHFPAHQVVNSILGWHDADIHGTSKVRGLIFGAPPKQ